jgi:signal transduction histidine kinase
MAQRLAQYAALLSTEGGCRDFPELSQRLLQSANSHTPLAEFLSEITHLLFDFSSCDAVELWVKRGDRRLCCEVRCRNPQETGLKKKREKVREAVTLLTCVRDTTLLDRLHCLIAKKQPLSKSPFNAQRGGFWMGNPQELVDCLSTIDDAVGNDLRQQGVDSRSLALLPIRATGEIVGLLQLKCRQADFFSEQDVEPYEMVAQALGLALVGQSAHSALHERIKELTCLYNLAQLSEHPTLTLEGILRGIVEMLPAAWQYPEITVARIAMDGCAYETAGFREGIHRQSTKIQVGGQCRGSIDIVYLEARPEIDDGPFLKEERNLIEAIARQIALIAERRHAAEEKLRLQDQLRHADRLATIGQLAAGVAHELNEPLGNILAFAQLAEKQPELPTQTKCDLGKIVKASLHAREIIKKLMLFARQMPPQKTLVDLNSVIEDGLYFLESRCAKNGVSVIRRLSRRIPRITADPSQLNQVLVNLMVNSIQAMPQGGTLQIETRVSRQHVVLAVEDDGIGMTDEVLKQIFVPFFTTKDIHEGTGLGLPVVHGIVSSHGGTISVRSSPDQGTRFEVRLPLSASKKREERSGNDVEE